MHFYKRLYYGLCVRLMKINAGLGFDHSIPEIKQKYSFNYERQKGSTDT